jgi:NitT/TauT family transport system permease protein
MHRTVISYPVSLWQRLYSLALMPLLTVAVVLGVLKFLQLAPPTVPEHISLLNLLWALGASFWRIALAYFFSLLAAVPLALWVTHNRFTERVLLPFFDVLESVPVLAFFPVVILFFVRYNFFDGAAIFVIFIDMMWNILFTMIGGLKTIPGDIKLAAQVFGIKGYDSIRHVLLPAVTPHIVTGSILAWGQGWNIIIVAEVLHTYLPHGLASQDLFGIGSVLVHASANDQSGIFIAAVLTMTVAIALLNLFVWQRLLHYAERFKFE